MRFTPKCLKNPVSGSVKWVRQRFNGSGSGHSDVASHGFMSEQPQTRHRPNRRPSRVVGCLQRWQPSEAASSRTSEPPSQTQTCALQDHTVSDFPPFQPFEFVSNFELRISNFRQRAPSPAGAGISFLGRGVGAGVASLSGGTGRSTVYFARIAS